MTIDALRDALDRIVEADPYAKDMQVRFGPEMHHVHGGF